MHRLRRLVLSLAVAFGALGPVALAPGPACAANSASSAALVVDTGGSVQEYCVEISGTVSGLELIKLANKQYGLDYAFGYGGQAVCRLAGTGSSSNDCLEDDKPYFWGYWRGTGGGGWSWSNSGAGNTSVGPGDVEGWAWGTGMNGGSHPQPPNTDYEDVCTIKDHSGGGGGGGSDDGGGGGGGNKDSEGASGSSGANDTGKDDTSEDEKDKRNGDRKQGDASKKSDEGNGKTADGSATSSDRTHEVSEQPAEEAADSGSGSGATSDLPAGSAAQAAGSDPVEAADGGGMPLFGAVAVVAGLGLVVGGIVANKRREGGAHRRG